MNYANSRLENSAKILFDAWNSGELLTELPTSCRPTTLDQGYLVQEELLKRTGDSLAGWKLGVGSPLAMRKGGLSRPLVGQILKNRYFTSGVEITLPALTPITLECEIAFILDRDLPPLSGRAFDPSDIRSTCVTFEVVRSRFKDRKSVGWPSFVADNVGFEALVVSDPICKGVNMNLLRSLNESITVYLDDFPKAKSLSGDEATDPLVSLSALYDHAAEHGITLRAGDIVSTGAMCEPFDISGTGHTVVARFLDMCIVLYL